MPVKRTKVLNKALKNHWKLTNSCEIKEIKGKLYVIVFVQKKVPKAQPSTDCLGIDVGYRHSCATCTDSGKMPRLGKRLDKIIKKRKKSRSERYRQRMKHGQIQKLYKNKRSEIKQLLDIEAKLIIRRSNKFELSVVVESPKVIANLRSGKLNGWARCYLAARLKVLARENSCFMLEVNPAYSSMTCAECQHVDSKSRCRQHFCCVLCQHEDHADLNGGRVLGQRGRQVVLEKIIPKLQSGCR